MNFPGLKIIGISAIMAFVVLVLSQVIFNLIEPKNNFLDDKSNAYLAVFLDNGQVYFGKIKKEDKKTLLLKEIFYVQVQGNSQDSMAKQSDISLLKLGNELHGPEDWMKINKDHILFIEQLKTDGKVAKAIEDYKK